MSTEKSTNGEVNECNVPLTDDNIQEAELTKNNANEFFKKNVTVYVCKKMGANLSQGERQGGRNITTHRYTYTPDTEHGSVVHRDKKKKSKFATLKKKLSKARRQSRTYDHTKALRDLLSSWSVRDIHALVEQYEATLALKELAQQSNIARPHANSYREDLSTLYDYKYFTDVDLIYQGTVFPVHRAILSVRCPYFRDLLARYPEYGAQIQVTIRTPGVDVGMFSTLLRYLYTGDFPHPEDTVNKNLNLLIRLADEFGTPNPLENDLRTLLESGMYADALLTFSSCADHNSSHDPLTPDPTHDTRTTHRHELRCHKAILAARSPFFRNLLLRRARSGEEFTERALLYPTCIQLDELVIPRRYARVLLHTLYLDSVDLSCIVRTSVSMCSLSEVQAMVSGKAHMTIVDEAMEIYQIGQFLEFPVLAQGCEDVIYDNTNPENLVSVLQWSGEAHGSQWVHRQALQQLRDEFLHVAHSPVLNEMNKQHLIYAVKSDFLQASELEVLIGVLKWGEQQLIRRLEEREPNLVSHTAHSISKKGIKKRDLNDIELREILADVLPYVRIDHVIPRNHDVLANAIKRGLVSVPPSHMLGDEGNLSASSAWVRGKNSGVYITPRAFLPYYEEAKCILEESRREYSDSDNVRLRTVHISGIPDTLYMVEDQVYGGHLYLPSFYTPPVDIIAGTIPVPSSDTVHCMIKRETELRQSKSAQRALSMLYSDRRTITEEIRLRVVREYGLPDSSVEVLRTSPSNTANEHLLDEARYHTPKRKKPRDGYLCEDKTTLSTPVSPIRSYSPVGMETSTCSDSALCEMMPDIALATASMHQMSLHEYQGISHGFPQTTELELDLGDGTSHHSGSRASTFDRQSHGGTLYI